MVNAQTLTDLSLCVFNLKVNVFRGQIHKPRREISQERFKLKTVFLLNLALSDLVRALITIMGNDGGVHMPEESFLRYLRQERIPISTLVNDSNGAVRFVRDHLLRQ
jgi:hypothetical protein